MFLFAPSEPQEVLEELLPGTRVTVVQELPENP